MKRNLSPLFGIVGVVAAAISTGAVAAEPAGAAAPEFWDPMVVTPAGQPSRVSESPSTTFVISGDELRRSGAPSLPEALRRVPGLDVRAITATDAQLGLRGFAYEVSDRILVLIDGRTVYMDFFGGTSWEMLPVSLIDIERIEIVMGPGASVYGNKAMLGTINIITRSAADYPFLEARLDAGLPQDGRVAARYGVIRGPWRFRATALARRLSLYEPHGQNPSSAGGGTLSATYSPTASTEATLEAGAMGGNIFMIPTGTRIEEFDALVGYVRARARHGLGGPGSPYGDVSLDVGLNAGRLKSPTFPPAVGDFRADYQTPYAELHHELRTELLGVPTQARWGGEVRLNTLDSTITTGERPLWNVAGFASNELLLGRWRVTTGLRVDRATLAKVSVSPRVSVVWSPAEHQQLRAAFNTGYNNPNHVFYFADFELAPAGARVIGNPHLSPEKVLYGELGWSGGLTDWLRGFANAFIYRFDAWISLDPRNATIIDIPWGNNGPFTAWGGEVGLDASIRRALSAYANYALIGPMGAGVYPYKIDPLGSPRHKLGAGLRLDLDWGGYVDVAAQYLASATIARLSATPTPTNPYEETALAPYLMANARGGYVFRSGVDLSLAVSNLFDDRTRHYPGAEAPARRVTATLAWNR